MTTNSTNVGAGFEATWNCLLSTNTEATISQWSVQVYPIPSNDIVYLEINNNQPKQLTINIVNSLGQLIEHERFASTKQLTTRFDLSQVPAGVYFMQIDDGETSLSRKFVIQR